MAATLALAARCPMNGSHCSLTLTHPSPSFPRLLQLAASFATPITRLCLHSSRNSSREQDITAFTSVLPHLRGLLNLYLRGFEIGAREPVAPLANALSQVSTLQQLELVHVRLAASDWVDFLNSLTVLTGMTALILKGSAHHLSHDGIAALVSCLARWPALQNLELSNSVLFPYDPFLALYAKKISHLKALRIRNTVFGGTYNRMSRRETKPLGCVLAALPNLQELHLDRCALEGEKGVLPAVKSFLSSQGCRYWICG